MSTPNKTTVIHHSADYDGIFCREIARKFLPDAELIGWDFGDEPLAIPDGQIYIMDLPVDRVFGYDFGCGKPVVDGVSLAEFLPLNRIVWIDHHKSSIETHPTDIYGYRIDGVAACRLAWQWFNVAPLDRPDAPLPLPDKHEFINRKVEEPLAVRLAGEYDVWDHRDNDADIAFQFGLDAQEELNWEYLLCHDREYIPANKLISDIVCDGRAAMRCYAKRDSDIIKTRSFMLDFEGLKFIALNTARCNSNTFAALDKPETGHDAMMGFFWNGKKWTVSMYHAAHRKDIDLSVIAKKHGGGGHRGACGFAGITRPFQIP